MCRLCGRLPFTTGAGSEPLHKQILCALRPGFRLLYPAGLSTEAKDLMYGGCVSLRCVCKLCVIVLVRCDQEQTSLCAGAPRDS